MGRSARSSALAPLDERPVEQRRRRRGRGGRRRRTTPASRRPAGGRGTRPGGCAAAGRRSRGRGRRRSATTISPSTTQRVGQRGQQRVEQLGEVAGERPLVAAGQLDVVAVAEHDAAEPVPLRLEQPAVAVGDRAGQLGQHRLERRGEGEDHAANLAGPGTATAPRHVQALVDRTKSAGRRNKEASDDVTLEHRRGRRRRAPPSPPSPSWRCPGRGRRRRGHRAARTRCRRRRGDDTDAGAHGHRVRARHGPVVPDVADISAGVQTRADTAEEAMDTIGTKSQALVDTLKGAGHRRGGHPDVRVQPVPELQQRRLDDQRVPGVDERHRDRPRRRPHRRGARRPAGPRRPGADAGRHLVLVRRSRGRDGRCPHGRDRERHGPRRPVRRRRRRRARRDRADRRGLACRRRCSPGRWPPPTPPPVPVAIEPGSQDLAADVSVVFAMELTDPAVRRDPCERSGASDYGRRPWPTDRRPHRGARGSTPSSAALAAARSARAERAVRRRRRAGGPGAAGASRSRRPARRAGCCTG